MASKKMSNKCKFEEGEKVLCYEPNPLKTKVLYDSKVLKVVPEKDDQGRRIFYKFLIHFQGWNSTWDRYVTDEFILKDTEENRKLQKELAEEAQLTSGGHLYRKERKKRVVKSDSRQSTSSSQLSEESADETSTVEEDDVLLPSNEMSLPKRRLPELNFSDDLRFHMGYNCHLTHEKKTLVQLPCQPNVVTLFENYLKYLARSNFSDIKEYKKKGCQAQVFIKKHIDNRFRICIEVLDGLRICFNYFLFKKLLINENEQSQYNNAINMGLSPPANNISAQNGEGKELAKDELNGNEVDYVQVKRENARSTASQYTQSQRTCSNCSLTNNQCSKTVQDTFKKVHDEYVLKADMWKAVPDSAYYEDVKQPAIIYGVYHLLRLLDKLPSIIKYTTIKDDRLSAIYLYCNGLLSYLSTQNHLFGIKYYTNNDMKEGVKRSDDSVRIKRTRNI